MAGRRQICFSANMLHYLSVGSNFQSLLIKAAFLFEFNNDKEEHMSEDTLNMDGTVNVKVNCYMRMSV